LSDEEGAVRQALRNPRFRFRTIRGIATATDLNVARVKEIINSLENKNLVRLSYRSQRDAEDALWGSLERLRELKEKLDTLKEAPPEALKLVKATQTLAAAAEQEPRTTLREYYDRAVEALELVKATQTLAAAAEQEPRTTLREYYDRAVEVARTTGEVATKTATAVLTAYQVVQLVAGWFGFPL
jgi:hypothetical protein